MPGVITIRIFTIFDFPHSQPTMLTTNIDIFKNISYLEALNKYSLNQPESHKP